MTDISLTEYGLAGLVAVALIYIFKLMWAKIEEKDKVIRDSHEKYESFITQMLEKNAKIVEENTQSNRETKEALRENTKSNVEMKEAVKEMPQLITDAVYKVLTTELKNG